MRVHELAKELGVGSKDLLKKARALGAECKSHMSAIPEDVVAALRSNIPAAPVAQPETPTPAEDPAPAPAVQGATQPEPGPTEAPAPATDEKVIRVRGAVIVKDLAEMIGVRANQLVARLMKMNIFATINERIDFNVAKALGEQFGITVEQEKRASDHRFAPKKADEEPEEEDDRPEDMASRPPVVTFLGHVDHGKTSLMDRIRDAAVAAGESGGITQHIGAYTVDVAGRKISFLDTPGHAAFTAMRARGANLTDIAVIVIAADDGIMPQTQEAIQHAQAAGVTLIVAINKMDLPSADADRVRQQLQAQNLAPEDWGGELICCEVSAQTGAGLDHLLEMLLLQSEMLELKANPKKLARGYVIEAQLEPGKGPTANLLVTAGTLTVGDVVLCGPYYGRVRALINDHGAQVKAAGPSTPVRCLGLSGVPEAGAQFRVYAKEKAAKALAEEARLVQKHEQLQQPKKASLESLFDQIQESGKLELRLVIKADTQGSVEAISHALQQIPSDKVSLNILLAGTGNISGNDVMLASASDAVVIGFHVAKETGVDAQARHEGVEIRLHSVIYELIDQVREAMTGLLAPKMKENVAGHAEVRQVFSIGKTGVVAGCLMVDGRTTPRHRVRVKRGDEVLYEGSIASLRHFQDEASEIRETQECGIRLDNFSAFEEGDILEFYEIEEVRQTL